MLALPEDDPEDEPVPRRVVATAQNFSPLLDLRVGPYTIRTTPEHPFWVVGRGWRAAHQLVAGDVLMSIDKRPVVLEAVEDNLEAGSVYNVEVEGYHTYFVGSPLWGLSIWSHNQGKKYFGDGAPNGANSFRGPAAGID